MRIFFIAIFCLFFSVTVIKAQTTLVPGDILFTSYNGIPSGGVAPDTFSFVILTPITAGTVIYFTERGYQGGSTWQASGTTEGTISWTSGSALAIGKEVTIAGIGASAARVDGVANGNVAIVSGGNVTTGLSLSNAGDQVLAFQGAGGNPASGAAVFITGINWALSCGTTTDASWNGAGCTYGPQTSLLPSGLTGGTTALLMGTAGATPNNSHGRFNCTGTPVLSAASIKAAILNKANWNFSTAVTTTFDIPAGCIYYGSGLPLHLINFSGRNQDGFIYLQWTSANEQNTSRFEIEKSENGQFFLKRDVVVAAGSGDNTYNYKDTDITGVTIYYRLKMVDKDGKFEYSPVIRINNNAADNWMLVYPNPSRDIVTITIPASLLNTVAVLSDARGKMVKKIRWSSLQNQVNLGQSPGGLYFLRFSNGQVQKIVKEY